MHKDNVEACMQPFVCWAKHAMQPQCCWQALVHPMHTRRRCTSFVCCHPAPTRKCLSRIQMQGEEQVYMPSSIWPKGSSSPPNGIMLCSCKAGGGGSSFSLRQFKKACLCILRMRYLGRGRIVSCCSFPQPSSSSLQAMDGLGGRPFQSLLNAYAPAFVGRPVHPALRVLVVMRLAESAEKAPHLPHHQISPLVIIK